MWGAWAAWAPRLRTRVRSSRPLILKVVGFYGLMSLVWDLQWWRSDLWLLVPPAWLGRRSGRLEHREALEANSTEFLGIPFEFAFICKEVGV